MVTRITPRWPPAGRAEVSALEPHAPGRDWLAILARPTLAEFARAFSKAPVLEASVLAQPIVGAAALRGYFAATRTMYEQIAFTSEYRAASSTWLEWRGQYRGAPVSGVTILTANADGEIAGLRIFCLPLPPLAPFAAELRRRLEAAQTGDNP